MAELDIIRSSNDSYNDYGKSFSQESCMNIHFMIHTGSKPFKCITCQKTFYQANSLKKSFEKKSQRS